LIEAIKTAQLKDLGVFIISPNDKGGQLYKAPDKIKKAIPHCSPIQWNARFCLQTPHVHTLSFGMTEPEHFEEMKGIFPITSEIQHGDKAAKETLDNMLHDDPYAYYDGKELNPGNSGLEIPLLLHWRKLWKCYDLLDFAKYRYKELKTPNHWVPGRYATDENINKINFSTVPTNIPLKEILKELHKAFYTEPEETKPFVIEPTKLRIIKH